MKITLDKKILGGFIICSLVLLVVAGVSYRNSERLISTGELVNHTQEVIYELDQVLISSVNAETGVRGYVITNDESYLEPFNDAKSKLFVHIENVKRLTDDNSAQQFNIKQVEDLAVALMDHLQKKIELRRKDFELAKQMVLSGEGKRLHDELRRVAGNAKQIEQGLLAKRKAANDEDAKSFNLVFFGLILAILVVITIMYFVITTNIRALRKSERTVSEQNWKLTGASELMLAIQGNKSAKELSQVIINYVGSYLNVQMGAVYLADEQNRRLSLTGSYALGSRRIDDELNFGEGIVGQSALEKKVVIVSNLKDEHFIINTGFGAVLPKNLVVFPVVFENRLVAVIVLGTLFDFTSEHKAFLEITGNSIAVSIVSAQSRVKIDELLEETQRQSEELEAQQEELKKMNDGLRNKNDLLKQSENELKAQQDELQQLNVELEEKANMLEEQKTNLENAKHEIEKKASEVERNSKYKSEFLANMSHELRTPLNSILILAQLLSENKHNRLGERELDYSRNIYNSGNDLLNLINEILDLSKVEAGKLELDIEEVSLHDVVDNLSKTFQEQASQKSLDLNIDLQSEVQALSILTDGHRLQQILRNLLSNAFKFTDKGGKVTLTIARDAGERKGMLSFAVSDTGIGIPFEKQKIIFDAFSQADGSTKRKYGGTGLGLSISRELAQALGGDIALTSEEGKGSTFTLYVPMKFNSENIVSNRPVEIKKETVSSERTTHKESVSSANALPEKGNVTDDRDHISERDRVVLIVEDEETFSMALRDLARDRGYKVVIANEGSTGISYARHYKPDAILLDIELPVMNGIEVLRQIKNDPALRHIPVQIISLHDRKKEGLELGAFDYIKKPVNTKDIHKAFEKIEKFNNTKLKKLLIVEDDLQQNKAISELIGNGDVKSFSAYSGVEADRMLNEEHFDCIIVDLGLPDMSGFELLEKIKVSEKLNRIPVIVYTGRDLKKEETARLSRLADTVVLKTVHSQERLLDETMLFLHRVESRLPKEKQSMIRKLHQADEVLKDKKILLVDDDVRNIYSLTNALEEEGLQCVIAENGKIAVDILKSSSDIDLVLMDIMMPEMDGYEATQEIRRMERFKKIPIIALTAKAMKGDKEKCLSIGMSDYISKPVNIEQLLSLMRVWLYQ